MSNSPETLRWGMLGCGDVAEFKSGPAYQQVAGFSLQAVMRRDFEKAKDYAHRHHVPMAFADANALIYNDEVDAVYIATPPDSHYQYALAVAEAGKPCCIEKPMAPSYQECREICDAFERKELPLFVAYYRRSLPRFQQIKSWLDREAIGELRHVSWHLTKPPSQQDLAGDYNWRTDARIAPGGYFDDLASHGLDLLQYLLGDIVEARGICTNQQLLYTAFDSVAASWVHQTGVTGTGAWNFGCRARADRVIIRGSKGQIVFSVFDEAPLVLDNDDGTTERVIANPVPIQLHHVQKMRDALLNGKPHPSSGTSAARTAWIMDKILQS